MSVEVRGNRTTTLLLLIACCGAVLTSLLPESDGAEGPADASDLRGFLGLKLDRMRERWPNRLLGALVYVCAPVTPCSIDAKLPGTDAETGLTPVLYLYADHESQRRQVAKPKSGSVTIRFDPKMVELPPSVYAQAPLCLRVDSEGKVVGVRRPLRLNSTKELKQFMGAAL